MSNTLNAGLARSLVALFNTRFITGTAQRGRTVDGGRRGSSGPRIQLGFPRADPPSGDAHALRRLHGALTVR